MKNCRMESIIFYLLLITLFVEAQLENKPHIVVVVADDLGWNDVGFHGPTQVKTPNLDLFASSGRILNNYYVQPICTPSRSALLTGQHPIHTGLQHDVILADQPYGLPLKFKILPEWLQKLGYSTHIVGKWHLGYYKKEYTPTFRGFDTHYGYFNGKSGYYDHTCLLGENWGLDFRDSKKDKTPIVYDQLGSYSTQLYTKRIVSLINNRNQSKPMFLYMSHQAVHSGNSYANLEAPDDYIKKFTNISDPNRRTFAAMMSVLDDGFGELVDALTTNGMLENTIILFTTDNGGPAAGFNQNAASNWPLRGVKSTLWEGGVRGAAFIWSSQLLKQEGGDVYNGLLHITDWAPTLYRAAGGDPTELDDMYGQDMWSRITLNLPSKRNSILHNYDPILQYGAIRVDNYKLIFGSIYNGSWDGWYGPVPPFKDKTKAGRRNIDCESIRKVKINKCKGNPQICLFDIEKDPCEYYNLAEKQPKRVKELLAELSKWKRSAVTPGNKKSDPKANPKYHSDIWLSWCDDEVEQTLI